MAWEKRRKSGSYYYRKRRIGGKVVSEFLGSGGRAHFVAEIERIFRYLGADLNLDLQDQEARIAAEAAAIDRAVDEVTKIVNHLLVAGLLVNGYHTHKDQWRQKRAQP